MAILANILQLTGQKVLLVFNIISMKLWSPVKLSLQTFTLHKIFNVMSLMPHY